MSGGSMGYIYYQIKEYADMLEDKELIDLANDFARLLHDCEWYHSADTDRDTYLKTVKDFKNKWLRSDKYERNDKLIGYINRIFDKAKQEAIDLIEIEGEK